MVADLKVDAEDAFRIVCAKDNGRADERLHAE